MRRFFAPHLPPAGAPPRFVLEGDEGSHLGRVLRAAVGDLVSVFDGRGAERVCRVVETAKDRVALDAGESVARPRPARDVLLSVAAPKGERMEWLVEKATECGVGGIVAVATERGVRDRASENVQRRWQRAALEACKQCGRADVPSVAGPVPLDEAIRQARSQDRALLVASPGAADGLTEVLAGLGRERTGAPRSVAIFVGPEGGFEEGESAALAAAGASPFGLGPFILRIETAALVAVHVATTASR